MRYNPHLMTKVRSKRIMSAADGQPCLIRVASLFPGYACSDGPTTVGAHGEGGGRGIATKDTDLAAMFGCQHCHDIVDRRDLQRYNFITEKYPLAYGDRLFRALVETHAILIENGIIVVPDGKLIQ